VLGVLGWPKRPPVGRCIGWDRLGRLSRELERIDLSLRSVERGWRLPPSFGLSGALQDGEAPVGGIEMLNVERHGNGSFTRPASRRLDGVVVGRRDP